MIGITGTNGKTTTAHMIRHILEYALQSCSLFGTVERYMNGESSPSAMTTYDAVQLQQWLHQSRDNHVIMEVSSHGLEQHRVDGMMFDFALFTNLSHEHLDYHNTLDHYFLAKQRLFYLLKDGGKAIVNTNCYWEGNWSINCIMKESQFVHMDEAKVIHLNCYLWKTICRLYFTFVRTRTFIF